MNKKILCLFTLMLAFVPMMIFSGCGKDDSKSDVVITHEVTFELKNVPDEKYFEVTSNPQGQVEDKSAVNFAVKFKNGYRPDGLVAKLDGKTDVTGVISDTQSTATYSTEIPLSHDVIWSYSAVITQDTSLSLDFSACEVGKITLKLSENLQNGNLKYAVFDAEPTDKAVTTSAEMTEFLGDKVKTADAKTLSVPFGSYVVFLPQSDVGVLYFWDDTSASTSNSGQSYYASSDDLNFTYHEYTNGDEMRHVVSVPFNNDSWNSMTALTNRVVNLKNYIAGTFAVQTLVDGSYVSGLASQNSTASMSGLLVTDDDRNLIQESFTDTDNTQHNYYLLGSRDKIYASMDSQALTEKGQKNFVDYYRVWVEDDLVMSISGIGSFNRDEYATTKDCYYLATEMNTTSKSCVKVDVSDYIVGVQGDYAMTYYLYIPKAKLTEILEKNSDFVTEYEGEKYGFAYLIRENNRDFSSVTKLTLVDYDFEENPLNPRLLATNTSTNVTEYGYCTYVNYANAGGSTNSVAPIYYLDHSQLSGYDVYSLCVDVPRIKALGMSYKVYSSYDYTLTSGDEKVTGSIKREDATTDLYGNTMIKISGITLNKDYTLKLTLVEKDYDTSGHEIKNASERTIYYYETTVASENTIPTDKDSWKKFEDSFTLNFAETKAIFFLTKLNTTQTDKQTTTEILGIYEDVTLVSEGESAEDVEKTYNTIDTAYAYTDMLGHEVKVTIDGETYTVMYMMVRPAYYTEKSDFYVMVTESTTENWIFA